MFSDGDLFRPILDFLRTGHLKVPKFISADRLQQEAAFYRIQIPLAQISVNETINTNVPIPTADFVPLCGGVYIEEPRGHDARVVYASTITKIDI